MTVLPLVIRADCFKGLTHMSVPHETSILGVPSVCYKGVPVLRVGGHDYHMLNNGDPVGIYEATPFYEAWDATEGQVVRLAFEK